MDCVQIIFGEVSLNVFISSFWTSRPIFNFNLDFRLFLFIEVSEFFDIYLVVSMILGGNL